MLTLCPLKYFTFWRELWFCEKKYKFPHLLYIEVTWFLNLKWRGFVITIIHAYEVPWFNFSLFSLLRCLAIWFSFLIVSYVCYYWTLMQKCRCPIENFPKKALSDQVCIKLVKECLPYYWSEKRFKGYGFESRILSLKWISL